MKIWLLVSAIVVFILSSATTFVQVKRRAFTLTCLGVTGQLFSFSFLLASPFIPENTEYEQFSTSSKAICCITGFILAAQQIACYTISLALSIEFYVIFYKREDVGKSLRLLLQVLCLGIPYISALLSIMVVLVSGGQAFVSIKDVGLCEISRGIVKNEWAIFLVRGIPEYTPIFPAFILSFAAVLPLALKLFKTQPLKQQNPPTTPQFESELPSVLDTSRSNKQNPCDNSSTVPHNLAAAVMKSDKILPRNIAIRMTAWCFIVSCIGIPDSLIGLIEYVHLIRDSFYQKPIDQMAQLYLGLGTHFFIFLVFATGKYAYEQYQSLWIMLLHGLQRIKIIKKQPPDFNSEISIEIVEHGKIITSKSTDQKSDGNDETTPQHHRKASSTSKELTLGSSSKGDTKSSDSNTIDDSLSTEKKLDEDTSSSAFTRLHSSGSGTKKPSLLTLSLDSPRFPSAFEIPSSPSLTMPPGQFGNSVSSTDDRSVSSVPNVPAVRPGTSTFSSRIITSQERHLWLNKPPARSISPDGLTSGWPSSNRPECL